MDFFTTNDSPIAVNIDGQAYSLPRFLVPALMAWAATIRQEVEDKALAQLPDADDRARFLTYFQPLPVDIADLLGRVSSPEGAWYVVDAQMAEAGVPAGVREKIKAQAGPLMIRKLAQELTRAPEALSSLGVDAAKEKADPLPPPPAGSEGSAGDGTKTGPATPPATEAATSPA